MIDRVRSKFGSGIMILVAVSLQFIFIFSYFALPNACADSKPFKDFQEIKSSDRIIVFAPHPDDESLGNSGIIRTAVKNRAAIMVVVMTNGDAFEPAFFHNFLKDQNVTHFIGCIGDMRRLETINAMRHLGLSDKDIAFLGYPDGGLKRLFEDYWDNDKLFKMIKGFNPFGPDAVGSNTFDHSPYSFSYEKNAPYSGSNVAKNLRQIMDEFKPTMIFYPDDGDDHLDHWATSAFVRYVALEAGFKGETYCYLIHKGSNWPIPLLYRPDDELLPPEDILELDADWFKLPLSKRDRELKEEAVDSHITQIFAMKNLLKSFVRTNEIFAYYPIIDIAKIEDDGFQVHKMPLSSFKDLRNDAKGDGLQKADDLTSCGFAYDDKNSYLFLKSTDVQTDLVYDFHLRIFDGNNYKRIDIKAENGAARYELKASNSIASSQPPVFRFDRETGIMSVIVERSLFSGARYLLMSADVRLASGHYIDAVSMRVFRFPDKL